MDKSPLKLRLKIWTMKLAPREKIKQKCEVKDFCFSPIINANEISHKSSLEVSQASYK